MNCKLLRPLLLGLTLTAALAVGAAASYDGVATVTGDTLSLQATPDAASEVLAQAVKGDVVLVVAPAETEGWFKVDYCTIQGYMSGEALAATDTYSAPLCYGKVDTDGGALNIRSGPSADSEKVGSLEPGALLPLNAFEKGWFKTEMYGTVGYVSAEYVLAVDGEGKRADMSVPDTSALTQQIVDYAKQFLGIPYVYGGSTPSGFDCSGFTSYVYKNFGYSLTRTAASQLSNGTGVDVSEIQPGDILCWRAHGSSKAATHVGIYIGDGLYIHSPSTGSSIRTDRLGFAEGDRYLVGVRRIV